MSTSTEYKRFKLTGPVNVIRTSPRELTKPLTTVYILMGPTGSGKSAFIESLSDGTLSISKNTLESVTQEVICYRMVNMKTTFGNEIILMDTPGFLDTKLSESRIATMVMRTLDELRQSASSGIVLIISYFHPITDIRMGASKRDIAKLVMEFAKLFNASGIHVATTMWNTICTPMKMADAEARHVALQTDVFKRSDKFEISVDKFEFSRESALLFMDSMGGTVTFIIFSATSAEKRGSPFYSMARANLLNRISQAEQQLQILAEDGIYARIPGSEDHQLLETTEASQKTVITALKSFLDDLYALDPAACPSNLADHPPPPPHRSFITRLRKFTPHVSFKKVFRKH